MSTAPMATSATTPAPAGFRTDPGSGSTREYYLNMGPQHPSTHGVLHLMLRLDGETVREVVPHLGYIHRSVEKMGESQTWLQNLHLTDRLDYLSCHMNNLGLCLALEKGCKLGVPERAEYLRVLVCELQRLQSHLLWWGCFAMDLGALSAFLYGFEEREKITDLFESLCGARLTMNYFRPGGVVADLPDGFIARTREVLEDLKRAIDQCERLVGGNLIFLERTEGIGILSPADAIAWGCSGPVARASGVDYDVRRDDPYGIYERLDFTVPLGTRGDCLDRYRVRMEEMRQSIRIVEQVLDALPEGPCRGKELKAVTMGKMAQVFVQVETARGQFGVYAVCDNSKTPYRIKYRSPNMGNVAALDVMARGYKVSDLVTILASLDPVIPDIDR